jgi:hypothetical protein
LRAVEITADAKSKVYGDADPALTYQITSGSLAFSDAFTGALTREAGEDVGTYAILQGTVALNDNYTLTYVGADLTITKATLTVTADNKSKQYSDPIPPFTVTYSGFVNGEDETVLGGALSCTTTATATSAPGTYPITCSGQTSSNYTITYRAGTLTVTQEDARATYTGALFASTSSTTSSTAIVTLAATVQDITAVLDDSAYDAFAGDIRNASITFVNRDAGNAVLCTAPIGLVVLADPKTGTATCNWTANIGNSDSQSYTVGMIINNYYTRNASVENTVVTVYKPLSSNFITGGGYIVLTNSAGLKAGTAGTKNNFGFSIKYNKSGTNLQGRINTIVRRLEADGIVHVYQIKGNVMTSLTVSPKSCPNATPTSPCTAVFNGKASIQDITDPLAPVSIDGNATLQVTMTDRGEPGNTDMISITVWNKSGGLWFSSNWNGTRTVEQYLIGGNLVVH